MAALHVNYTSFSRPRVRPAVPDLETFEWLGNIRDQGSRSEAKRNAHDYGVECRTTQSWVAPDVHAFSFLITP
jgi:hypothetical protein